MSSTTYVEGNRRTFVAGADLSALQFTAVKLGSTDGQVVSSTGNTDTVIGILMNAPVSGDSADVYLRNASGTCKAVAGSGGWTAGDKLTTGTGGKLITTTNSGDSVVGIALHTVNASDIGEFAPAGFVKV